MPNNSSDPIVDVSVADVAGISVPANTLIKKVSNAVGGIFEPYQITRIAKAEAKASLIRSKAEIEITELHRRAVHRLVEEEARRQKNIEDITEKALSQLDKNSDPDAMEDDWITNFFDKCRIVSDENMQDLWSRILAGEANVPGRYSKRTVNALSDLDKADAALFAKLCGFCWVIGEVIPLVLDTQESVYNRHGVNFGSLSHLESIGLIQYQELTGFRRVNLSKRTLTSYYGHRMFLEFSKDSKNELDIGSVCLTRVGKELAPICGSRPVDGFLNYVMEAWKEHNPTIVKR